MIFTFKKIIWGWSDKNQDIVFKSTKVSDISDVKFKIVPLDNSWGKKKKFEKVMFFFEMGYVFNISSGVRDCLRGTNLKRYWGDSCLINQQLIFNQWKF